MKSVRKEKKETTLQKAYRKLSHMRPGSMQEADQSNRIANYEKTGSMAQGSKRE